MSVLDRRTAPAFRVPPGQDANPRISDWDRDSDAPQALQEFHHASYPLPIGAGVVALTGTAWAAAVEAKRVARLSTPARNRQEGCGCPETALKGLRIMRQGTQASDAQVAQLTEKVKATMSLRPGQRQQGEGGAGQKALKDAQDARTRTRSRRLGPNSPNHQGASQDRSGWPDRHHVRAHGRAARHVDCLQVYSGIMRQCRKRRSR